MRGYISPCIAYLAPAASVTAASVMLRSAGDLDDAIDQRLCQARLVGLRSADALGAAFLARRYRGDRVHRRHKVQHRQIAYDVMVAADTKTDIRLCCGRLDDLAFR